VRVEWTGKARDDLARLFDFLAAVNPAAAGRVVQSLTTAAGDLVKQPRIGEGLEQYQPRDVRRVIVGHYEMRYELTRDVLYVLRLWHTREDR
jgi:plasmid stabilization system protein ParE